MTSRTQKAKWNITSSMIAQIVSMYYMIDACIRNLTASFYNGLEAVFGNMYLKREMENLNEIFGHYITIAVNVLFYGEDIRAILSRARIFR